ncbi:Gfo/Idh/MocA family protein [Streptomyces tsukubensis]|uniref:Oxidoreductase n=1 Tax=Streptomyces tsukubensis TaxID=83656 RepID=A0A1V4A823_9ACTN|nr:Gfo/Idh/MocA family oxidoreductase [Streptomyces tsukubensis]OON77994.1 oxidoreductase [Streptomyces tsukubensis]QFR97159.1 gfo/Idh/MocA family oxidoreductase [Streptomyces tsukubensis]
MGEPLRIGIVGAGKIVGAYLDTLPRLEGVRLSAVTDLDPSRAEEAAERAGGSVAVAGSVAELLARDDVDAVLNLTIPAAHTEVALAAIAAGKHVYGEKPLATTREEADSVLAAARAAGVRVGCAPDTVLGTGTQTARKAVDDGRIGRPVAATAFMTTAGHERWHPDPEFYYRPGGGPLLDMGPYYLSALVHLLGPVVKVTGAASTPRARREIGSGPRAGETFPVEVDTHVTGVLQHEGGALTTLIMSFDIHAAKLPRIEIHGTEGSLSVPDPNRFEGPVELHRDGEWETLPVSAGYPRGGRGTGLADLAGALRADLPHRASAELARHVLDVMLTLLDAAKQDVSLPVIGGPVRPEPVV